jgi:hypothetical protein
MENLYGSFSPLSLLLNNNGILVEIIYGTGINEDRCFATGEAALPV